MAPRRARHSGNRLSSGCRDGPQDSYCSGSVWMTECQSRWVRDKRPRAGRKTMADKTSIAWQRLLAIGTVLLAAVWSLSFIATVNGQSPPGTLPGVWTMKAPLPAPRAEVAAVAF